MNSGDCKLKRASQNAQYYRRTRNIVLKKPIKNFELPKKYRFFKFLKNNSIKCSLDLWNDFNNYPEEKFFKLFLDDLIVKSKSNESKVNDFEIKLKNGKAGEEYKYDFSLPPCITHCEFEGLEDTGLAIETKQEGGAQIVCSLTGTPKKAGDVNLVMHYTYDGWLNGRPMPTRSLTFTLLPDPKELWKNEPTPVDIEYYQDPKATCLIPGAPENGTRTLLAASLRGRSHAHHGKPRDDNFHVAHDEETGWYVLAVADGAGSAAYARKGSQLACDTAVEKCIALVKGMDSLKETIEGVEQDRSNPDLLQKAKKMAYSILAQAAFDASKAIQEEAQNKKREAKEYASTLLLVMCKRVSERWFVMSFGIGDGAMAVLTKENGAMTSKLLGRPDEGEFSGQTCFITMRSLFADAKELMNRIQVQVLDDIEAILLMTDGVSDAKFETSANLENAETWQALWKELEPFTTNNDKDGLLEWLDFWSQGNHDDRTIAILY